MRPIFPLFYGLGFAAAALAQNESVLPAALADLPGNAALSMPLRWSHGTMQVIVDEAMLPPNFVGKTISGVRLRRPAFPDEPAYPALQRTLTVRGGFGSRRAGSLDRDLVVNRPANVAVLFGPAAVAVPATPAQSAGTDIGQEFLTVPFTTPLVVDTGNLFLEFEASDAPLVVLADHWVDAVWVQGLNEHGYVVSVGDGSCTTRTSPTVLAWTDPSTGPVVGGTAALRLRGAEPHVAGTPGTFAFVWFGIDPQPRAVAPGYVGYGNPLAALDPGLAGCHQWAPLDGILAGITDQAGGYTTSFDLVSGVVTTGMRIGVQGAWLDTSRPGLPLSVSNGLMLVVDEIGVGTDCGTQFFPGTATTAPWQRFLGQMPVLVLEHD